MAREMKDSGIEWIGQIPKEWELIPFRRVLKERQEKNTPIKSTERLSLSIELGVTLYADKTTNLDRFKDDFEQYKLAHEGDLVMNSMNMIVGASGVSDYFGCVSPAYYTYYDELEDHVTAKFCEYIFKSKPMLRVLFSMGKGIYAIVRGDDRVNTCRLKVSKDDLKSLKLPIPSVGEQRKIVHFVKEQCFEIDAVLDKTRASIEEYKKLKQALITQAVTRGIRPNREMKYSGSIWFGKIPIEWDAQKIKYMFHIKKDIAGEEGHTVLSITQRGVMPKDLSKNEGQIAESYSKYQIVKVGDFAMNHMDLLTGWVDISKYEGVTSPDYRVFVLDDADKNDKEYYLYMMQMCYTNRIFYGLGAGVSGLGRWRLQADKFLNFVVAVPPAEEQHEIAMYLTEKCGEMDTLIAKKEQFLTELEAYKKSLIYEYVTGKKEVPQGWQSK